MPVSQASRATMMFVVLVVVAVAASVVSSALVPSIGLVVMASALFLRPRYTAILAAVAIVLSLVIFVARDFDIAQYRVGNVIVGSLLGVLAAWAIDRRVQRIEALRASEAAVLASVPDGIALADPRGIVERVNPALEAMAPAVVPGRALHEALGHVLPDGSACPGGCPLDLGEPIAPARTGESISAAGRLIPVEYTVGRTRDGSRVLCLRDVSSRVAADRDRRALLEEAARQRERTVVLERMGLGHGLPEVPGVEVDLCSISRAAGARSGRDLVDVSCLPDGRIVLLVVDAVGRELVSALDAWKVLYVARALLTSHVPLEEVVERSAAAVASEAQPPSASVLAGILDPRSGIVEVASGGHPPALLVRSNGSCDWMDSRGQAVGGPQAGPRSVASAVMTPGDWLVLYTDGVVDGTRDAIEGLSVLRSAAVARRGLSSRGWAEGLMRVIHPQPEPTDESTILAVRLSPDRAA